ncbi:MAG: tetratricopeptide repeat protein [Chloroflexota bacterium]|nr:tetratricopeptide repeat protein [Chloroflexota bacterium]
MRRFHLFVAALCVLVLVACQGEATGMDDLLESGRAHLEAGEYAEAIADLEAAIEADPDNSEAYFLLGQAYNQTGDLMKAADEFRTVIALDPDKAAAAHHNLGVTYFQLQEPGAAVAEFQAALELDPDDPDSHYQLGAAYLVLALSGADLTTPPDPQLLEQAIAEFETALELRENMPEALIGMGNVYIQQGDYAAAIDTLQRATEQMPDSPEGYYALGEAYARSGDTTGACEAYTSFLTLDPPPNWRAQGEQAMASLGCP